MNAANDSVNPYETPNETRAENRNGMDGSHAMAYFREPIELQGSISLFDLVRAQRLIAYRRWPQILATIAGYILIVLLLVWAHRPQPILAQTYLMMGFLVFPLILPLVLGFVWIGLRHEERKRTGIFADSRARITQEGIMLMKGDEEELVPWSAFVSGYVSDHVAVLYLARTNSYWIVSRSRMTDRRAWESFHAGLISLGLVRR